MTRYAQTTLEDATTGTLYELEVSIETSSVCAVGGPDHYETSIGIEAARNLTTGQPVDPDDLPRSVWAKFDTLRASDL